MKQKQRIRIVQKMWVQYLLVLSAAVGLYGLTCAPAVLWQDGGLFVYRIWHNDLQGNLGIALGHPLYIMIGILAKSIPVGEFAWRVNFLSAIFGAVAVANLFLLLRLWLDKVWPAIIGALTLALSWTFWQNAVIAEVYSLYAAQFLTELLVLFCYVRTKRVGYLYLLGLLNGLAIANHLWGVLPLVCYAIFLVILVVRKQIRFSSVVLFVVLWVVGAIPYEYLILKNIFASGDISGTLSSALFGKIWRHSVLNTSISAKVVFENIVFVLLNFPTPNLLLLFVGLWLLCKKAASNGFAGVVLSTAILFFAFAFRYTVPDRHAFFLPFYCIAGLMVGLGADWLIMKCRGKEIVAFLTVFALLPIPVYLHVPELARRYYKPLGQRRQRPYRDEYTYWLRPWKTGYHGAERFAREALEEVEQGAIIYAYTTDVHALLYVQEVMGERPDVKIVSDYDSGRGLPAFSNEWIASHVGTVPIYVTSPTKGYCPPYLLDNFDFVQKGVLYKAVAKKTSTQHAGGI